MKENEVFNLDYYKEATSIYDSLLSTVESMKARRENTDKVRSYIKENINKIENVLSTGKRNKIDEINKNKVAIKQKYDFEREYISPEKEILRRQDWDLKLANMDKDELNSFVNNLDDSYKLSNYQYQTLKKQVGNSEVTTKLIAYAEKTKLGKEYELTEEWINNENLLIKLSQFTPNFLWKFDFNEGRYNPIDYKNVLNESLNGYNVNVH